MELGSHSWTVCLATELFSKVDFSDTVFVNLFHTAIKTSLSGVHKLLCTGRVPTSLTSFGGG